MLEELRLTVLDLFNAGYWQLNHSSLNFGEQKELWRKVEEAANFKREDDGNWGLG